MISVNDAKNTLEFKDGYVIYPNLEFINWNVEKYKKEYKGKLCSENFSYSSDKNKFLTINQLKKIAKDNIDDFELDK